MQGLKIVKDNYLMPLEISTDSIEVINFINNVHESYSSIICECRSLMHLLGDPKLSHTYREQNKVADLLAKEGAKKRLFERTRILQVPPMFANETVWADILGTTYPREISTHNSNLIATNATIYTGNNTIPLFCNDT
ncbi:hypothetical protein R3W88_022108 [Solanum pinnatisectum]|uniref:RNase H type-1 domain-containing protein n=1 Tax=Solanum pinnatisectum TaxID=50273 RepID=A0AAV9LWG5_9SOLN|nr:hypothetical protein R3W88_022108 [Solanum pinnatisectum]